MKAAAEPEQTPQQIAAALEAFLAESPAAVVLEDGKVLFDMRRAKYSLSTEHGRCTVQFWGEEGNLVRRVSAAVVRSKVLRLTTHRFGHVRTQLLEIAADLDRRTPSTREATRIRFLKVLERALFRQFPDCRADAFRTAMDLEKSFGPAYARGLLVRGQQAWAVIAVNREETQTTVDGILTLGLLWLHACRESGDGRRVVAGLKLVVPRGMGTLTLSRLAWINAEAAPCELWELDERGEEMEPREAADHGNLKTRLIHAPNLAAAHERFAEAAARVLALVPEAMRSVVEQRVRTGGEMAFLLHGLEFARVRVGASAESFNRVEQLTFGAGANAVELTADTEADLRELVTRLFERRTATGDKRDPLYRMQPERWLESVLRRDVTLIEPHLDPAHVYTQVPAFAASDRGMLDLLSVSRDGRLAVIELKADEDLHLALQGLDYWVRVRWHHLQTADHFTGLGEFQRHGYFGGVMLAKESPHLYLVAPALRIHPATETVLRYLSPRVDWRLVALDERWRSRPKAIWRKHNRPQTPAV
ncbi:hypothetical protein FTO74_02000 [Granulicella sp. WH15]|uniref:hypothetical protein n=1 Tax=Granulicella sp. WH15 TaxID=2602070 RepID=UPI001366B78B|nr:hypothetical protein [Granulicella sp. WH15]QHN02280.1 hypothetical protein FTO74_02000 [Granulicella sp. WH15]